MPRRPSRATVRRTRRRQRRRPSGGQFTSFGRLNSDAVQNVTPSYIRMLRFGRTLITGLPLPAAKKALMTYIYDVFFNLIDVSLERESNYIGAQCVFKVTPGCLLKDSPLVAKLSETKYSFPSFPVKVKNLSIRITNVTQQAERAGKWVTVYIPFREMHEENKYDTLATKMSFKQLCQLPHARNGNCNQDLVVHYKSRDRSDYCSRARELSEAIGILVVCWDIERSADDYKNAPTNSDFACEFEMTGTIVPLLTLSGQSRTDYLSTTFEPIKVTRAETKICVVHGRRYFGTEAEIDAQIMDTLREMEVH